MRKLHATLLLAFALSCAGTTGVTAVQPRSEAAATLAAPRAAKRPTVLRAHGEARTDEYYWLNERENPEVLAYLEAENAYREACMAHTAALEERLFAELVGRIEQDDSSVPVRDGAYFYYRRFEEGGEYAIVCRRPAVDGEPGGAEEVLLDGNALARGHDYFALAGASVTRGGGCIAYATDTVGRRIYTIRFKDLASGATLADALPAVTGNMAWANDDRTLFYAKQDPVTLRSYQIWRHELGTDPARDALVYEEADETFSCRVGKSKSDEFLLITSSQTLSTEVRFLDADDPRGEFRVLAARERELEYDVEHLGDSFYVRTNLEAENFRLMRTPVDATARENWVEVVPHRPDVLLAGFDVFQDFLVLSERSGGLEQIRIRPWRGGGEHTLDFGEPAYAAGLGDNRELDTDVLRFGYSSLTTPDSVFDYDMRARTKVLRKQERVLGGFDPAHYVTERLHATARDGTRVPISLVVRQGFRRNGKSPLLLYAYGSYGYSTDASFRSSIVSLLDRGFVYAIAHVRGGQELGRRWYEDGKLLRKKNTFTDFIDCAEHLVERGYADRRRVYAAGGSAGGLLMGAIVNMRPDLFDGVVAAVPFVDVVTTMLDDSIPLTTSEYDEWGNPNERAFYDYMLSYSPYDNVRPRAYPNLLVTTGLHDSQVQYFEPAKWVARLRDCWRGDNLLFLRTNMEAGHGGASGRFRRLRETANEYAFLLDLAGLGAVEPAAAGALRAP